MIAYNCTEKRELIIARLREVTNSGITHASHNKDVLSLISKRASQLLSSISRSERIGKLDKLPVIIAKTLNMKEKFSDINKPENNLARQKLVYQITEGHLSVGKKSPYELHKTFERHYIESFFSKIEKRLDDTLNSELDPETLDKLPNVLLKEKLKDYKISSLESLNPKDTKQAIMMRIKTRLFYEMNKNIVSANFAIQDQEGYDSPSM